MSLIRLAIESLEYRALLSTIVQAYNALPFHFEPSFGQAATQGGFLSIGSGHAMLVSSTQTVLTGENDNPTVGNQTVVRMELVEADPDASPIRLERLPGRSNYFLGNDPSKWITDVPHYAKVKYQDVYPGIDVVYYGNYEREYDFIVSPGADPNNIRLRWHDADEVDLDVDGNLVIQTDGATLVMHAPVIYQRADGAKHTIEGNYVLLPEDEVSFQISTYDRTKTLVIDPVIAYSTYLGGVGSDGATDIAVDGLGNAYVVGRTNSIDFPVENAFQPVQAGGWDVFVSKLNAAGDALVYSTYLGGSENDGFDEVAIAVDSSGQTYVTGETNSKNDFPVMGGVEDCGGFGSTRAFLTKLDTFGLLAYSTCFGRTLSTVGHDIAVDTSSNAYIAGRTFGGRIPISDGAFQPDPPGGTSDAFVTKLDTTEVGAASLVYATYLGGSGRDQAHGIAVDASGNAYVTGSTNSTDFPTVNAFQAVGNAGPFSSDAFVAKLNAAGSDLLYSTYLGGCGNDNVFTGDGAIAIDTLGDAYVTGATSSMDFPTTLNAFQTAHGDANDGNCSLLDADAFVTKVNTKAIGPASLVYSTFLGGNRSDQGQAIAVHTDGRAHVVGDTASRSFPTTPDALQPINECPIDPDRDPYVTILSAAGDRLEYSSYLGTCSLLEKACGVALDGAGNAYVSGVTDAEDFPLLNPVQPKNAGGFDAFIVKISAIGMNDAVREPGDSNEDCEFNQADIVLVVQGGKYRNGQPANWAEGDWNGDGVFDQFDVIAALQAGNYLQGPFCAKDAVFAEIGA